MMAAIRLRSLVLKMFFGVRLRRAIKSGRLCGVYLGVGALAGRYFSSLGSRNLTNLHISPLNMI